MTCLDDDGTCTEYCAGNAKYGVGGICGSFFTKTGKLNTDIFSSCMGTYGMLVNTDRSIGYGSTGTSGSGGGGINSKMTKNLSKAVNNDDIADAV